MSLLAGLSRQNTDVSVALDAGLLSSFDPASQRYECVACPKVGYGDVIPHLCSSQHRNSAAWDTIQSGMPNEAMLSILSDIIREAKIQDEIEAVDKKVFSYQCKVCPGKRPFNGLAPLESHLCGGDHGKNKVRLGLIRSHPSSNSKSPRIQQNSPERDYQIFATRKHPRPSPPSTNQMRHNVQRGIDSRLGNSPPSSISGRGVRSKHSPYRPTRTSTSDTFSDSLEPPPSAYRASSGEANSPRSPSSYGYLFLTPGAKDALDSGTVVEREKTGSWTSYFCKACNVPLTGAKPLIQHVESSKHIKKVNGFNNTFFQPTSNTSGPSNDNSGPLMQDFAYPNLLSAAANEAITSGVVEDRGGSYFCRVCNVPLTGPMPLNQHADSEKHRKKAAMSTQLTASMSRLNINPYDGFHVSPPRPKVEHVSDSRILDPQELERQGRQPSDEEACNDDTETDGLVQAEIPAYSRDSSSEKSLKEQHSRGTKKSAGGVTFAQEDPMVTALSTIQRIDGLEDKESLDFCQFITSELKKLDPDLCKKAKRKIQMALFEFQDIQEQRDGNYKEYPCHASPHSPSQMSSVPLLQSSYANSLLSPKDFIQDTSTVPVMHVRET